MQTFEMLKRFKLFFDKAPQLIIVLLADNKISQLDINSNLPIKKSFT